MEVNKKSELFLSAFPWAVTGRSDIQGWITGSVGAEAHGKIQGHSVFSVWASLCQGSYDVGAARKPECFSWKYPDNGAMT